ncbi:HDOD domain-containing protein [Campylobacter sp. RM12327]|uniref:HDOD domain-containing protein n=1 Tax=Campylobacter sputorum TaxID=206 RepID=UPI000B7719B5|nr:MULTISPECIES: HDOD domain-containing protein [Campylobacter]ASM39668.1 HDOD domain-containing signal-transduction protein [Campylobacter sputorum]MBE7358132.1 HDOD domain-containing protein [Campylobacter sp. RM11302]MBF6668944.1 HDOD domain-containing protein [Campylobacter sp. RM12327]MBF6673858.1 HDOD domain-containing protein [Campylobacter sp. RM13538]MBF6676720.1 HDOD domain-containing protein [Campylobacter sp. RM12321]
MNDTIYTKIKALPPLSDTVVRIQKICNDPDSSIADLSKIVENDPMLTANILRSANSPLYGFSREINDVSRAISLFGMATIKGFALSSAVKRSFNINLLPYNMGEEKFLIISSMQNALMLSWYKEVDSSMLDILSPASFLMEIGKIVLANELIEQGLGDKFKDAIKNVKSIQELAEIENKFLNISNEVVTASIFEQWNLEKELVDVILHSNNPMNAPTYIKDYCVAVQIVKSAVNIFYQLEDEYLEKYTLPMIKKANLDKEVFLQAIKKVKEQ